MKRITKIQSVSDIITNSSSEVFVMTAEDANYYAELNTNGCVSIERIDWDWVFSYGPQEYEMVCDICNLNPEEVRGELHTTSWGSSWYMDPNEETWKAFCEVHKEEIEEKLIGLYWVDIEDHFEDAYDVIEDARDDSRWTDYRH